MRIGAFELEQPLPQLREPHAFAMISPWIDVGGVGSATLAHLETHFQAKELGRLRKPGLFYDFTRYRPLLRLIEGRREIQIPNTFIRYACREQGNDLLFLHCLEPHMLGETYAESVLRVLDTLKVKRYCTLGAMYDSLPHTRPLRISGTASDAGMRQELTRLNINPSGYQGPTTINILVSQQAPQRGIETLTLIVHLPHYAQLEQDYSGQYSLLRLLSLLYGFSLELTELKQRGEEQYRRISLAVNRDPQLKGLVEAMERLYDARAAKPEIEETEPLSPEVERFLREMGRRLDQAGNGGGA